MTAIEPMTPKQRYRAKLQSAGLCLRCRHLSRPGRSYCAECSAGMVESNRRRAKRRIAAGLCRFCDAKATRGTMCEEHADRDVKSVAANHRARRKAGRCLHCGTPSAGKSHCTACAKKNGSWTPESHNRPPRWATYTERRQWQANRQTPEERRALGVAAKIARYHRLVLAGKCRQCGRKARRNKTTCAKCGALASYYMMMRQWRLGNRVTKPRKPE